MCLSTFQDLKEQKSAAQAKLEDYKERKSQVKAILSDVKTDFEDDIGDARAENKLLRTKGQAGFGQLAEIVNVSEDILAVKEKDIYTDSYMSGILSSLNQEISRINQKISSLNQQISSLNSKIKTAQAAEEAAQKAAAEAAAAAE